MNRLAVYWRARDNSAKLVSESDVPLSEREDFAAGLERLWEQEHNEYLTRRLMELLEPEFTPSTWQAFCRQVVNSVSTADVATELGLTVNAVLIAKSRVLQRFRQEADGFIE